MSTGKIINISNKLDREPKFLQIDEELYKVDSSKGTVTKFLAMQNDTEGKSDIEMMEEALKLFLGRDKYKELEDKHPEFDFANWQVIFFATVASAMNRSYEELEESFRKTSK